MRKATVKLLSDDFWGRLKLAWDYADDMSHHTKGKVKKYWDRQASILMIMRHEITEKEEKEGIK